jgi:hypothetical protein
MPVIETIQRAFLSYSREDALFANQLARDLRTAGFEVWIDFKDLAPGTPDWEAEIRSAIAESFAVLLVATPASRLSPYVRSEILLAQARDLPIYAIWAAGDTWIDAISMNLAHIQYQDFRGDAYDANLRLLVERLVIHGGPIPDHFLYKDFYLKGSHPSSPPRGRRQWGSSQGGEDSYNIFAKQPLEGFMQIDLAEVFQHLVHHDALDVIFVKPSVFTMGVHLLDAIYTHYLSDRYPPFSYGVNWILCSGWGATTRLAFDWRWRRDTRAVSTGMADPPGCYGMVAGSSWAISEKMPQHMTVLAVNDEWLLDRILTKPKAITLITQYMEEVQETKTLDLTGFRKVAVVAKFFFSSEKFNDRVFVQSRPCSPESRERWSY